MKSNPLVSVIIACYNQEKYIAETLDSVLAQTYPTWECIVVDDGSTDRSAQIVQRYTTTDDRIKYVYQENGRQAKARNTGLDLATGNYIQFLDADDLLEPKKLQTVVEEFLSHPELHIVQTEFVFCRSDDATREIIVKGRHRLRLRASATRDLLLNWDRLLSTPIHTYTYKRSLIEKYHIRFDTYLSAQEDFGFHLKIFSTKPGIGFVDIPLCRYRIGHPSTTQSVEKMAAGTFTVLNNAYRTASVSMKAVILYNCACRMAQLLFTSLRTRKNILWTTMRIARKEWLKHPTTICLCLPLLPLGVVDKIMIALYTKLKWMFQ